MFSECRQLPELKQIWSKFNMELSITTEHLKKYSIMVGTPMYGGQCSGMFTKSTNDLAKVCAVHGIDLQFYYLFNESLVQRARNYVVDEFLRSSCTHLMFIDADIGFAPDSVLTLLGIQTMRPDEYDVMTGAYPKKSISWDKVKKAVELGKAGTASDLSFYGCDFVLNLEKGVKTFKLDTPVSLAEAGTGFMLIPREVFEKYATAYPELKYTPDHVNTDNFDGSRDITAFFDCEIDPDSRRYLSEDYFFCRNAKKIGIKIHMCPWLDLQHVGSYIFRGSMAASGSLNVPIPTKKTLTKTKKRNKINR